MSKKLAVKKRILITAGPTWVPIDRVRVISNLASGETGCLLAKKINALGFGVTLLLGPGSFLPPARNIKVKRFRYYAELAGLLMQELKQPGYAAIIHAAAVADYRPKSPHPGKISSGWKNLKLELVPTQKLIANFKKYRPKMFTVGFKFEPGVNSKQLLARGRRLLKKEDLSLVVANSDYGGYRAYILGQAMANGPFRTKPALVGRLAALIKAAFLKEQ